MLLHSNVIIALLTLALACYLAEMSPLMPMPKRMVQWVACLSGTLLVLRDFNLL